MKIIDKFLEFHEKLVKKNDPKRYSSLLKKRPFEEIEDDDTFSTIHDLIEEGFLDFISLDIGNLNSTKYTINLSDKAINEIEKIKNT